VLSGATQTITATTNDGAGVNWSISSSGAGGGVLPLTGLTTTYTAPKVTITKSDTVTATSVTDPTIKASLVITVIAPGIPVAATVTYDDNTPFAGMSILASVTQNADGTTSSNPILTLTFDAAGKVAANVPLLTDTNYIVSLIDAAGTTVFTVPVVTSVFDLNKINSISATVVLRKADKTISTYTITQN